MEAVCTTLSFTHLPRSSKGKPIASQNKDNEDDENNEKLFRPLPLNVIRRFLRLPPLHQNPDTLGFFRVNLDAAVNIGRFDFAFVGQLWCQGYDTNFFHSQILQSH